MTHAFFIIHYILQNVFSSRLIGEKIITFVGIIIPGRVPDSNCQKF